MSGGASAHAKRAIRRANVLTSGSPPSHLRRPGEEVRLDDAVQSGRVLQLPAFQQPHRVVLGLPCQINTKGRLQMARPITAVR